MAQLLLPLLLRFQLQPPFLVQLHVPERQRDWSGKLLGALDGERVKGVRVFERDQQQSLLDALHDERQAKVVELRFYGELSEEEIAEVLGITARTVRRDWVKAREWLYHEVRRGLG